MIARASRAKPENSKEKARAGLPGAGWRMTG
jgi:hypothetical protein